MVGLFLFLQTLKDGSSTGLGMTIDMGDMGTLNYEAEYKC